MLWYNNISHEQVLNFYFPNEINVTHSWVKDCFSKHVDWNFHTFFKKMSKTVFIKMVVSTISTLK